MIAALFVQSGGAYAGVAGVDLWPEERDARLYSGPHPVVAHPPCTRWSKLAYVIQKTHGRAVGDDGGCFLSALTSVRRWGGVLEHPHASAAWAAYGLIKPPRTGGWVVADFLGGWTCCVEQGRYGHPAQKATWLYANGCELPSLDWSSRPGEMLCDHMNGMSRERDITPPAFRDLLLSIARSAAATKGAA